MADHNIPGDLCGQLQRIAAMPDTLPVNGTAEVVAVVQAVIVTPADARAMLPVAHPTPQGNEETVEARALIDNLVAEYQPVVELAGKLFKAEHPNSEWSPGRAAPCWLLRAETAIAALAPPIREHGEGVRELAAEIVDEAARCWTWEAGDEAGHAYRLKACAERREEWEDDDCPHDGSCVECVSDMHEHFETSASKERRRELRNLAAKIRGLPAHVIVRQSLGEYLPCEHSSEIVNELGNTIKFRIFAQAGQTRDGDDGGLPKVVVHAFGPTSKAIHTWTVNEARELHRLLSLAFPALSAQPVKDAVQPRYLSDRFEWAAPADQQEDAWIVRFCDKDCGDQIWTGPDAAAEAWASWERYAPSYNIYVFQLARLSPKSPASVGLDPETARVSAIAADLLPNYLERGPGYERTLEVLQFVAALTPEDRP
jgi:hypothetical protein